MPRPNQPRDVFAEDHLAQRIKLEREKRGWTYEGLAKRMTDAGCAINQSALYKVEQGQPRRRITVDELVALARVFETPVEDLLTDPRLLAHQAVVPLLSEWRTIFARHHAATEEFERQQMAIEERLRAMATDSPEIASVIRSYWDEWVQQSVGEDKDLVNAWGRMYAARFLPSEETS